LTAFKKRHDVSGAILAGGRSERFGREKASTVWNGKPLVKHVFDALSPLVAELLISTGETPVNDLGIEGLAVADTFRNAGPLSGIAACLEAASRPWLLVVACDLPLITTNSLDCLLSAAHPPRHVVYARSTSGRTQPLCACYHRAVHRPMLRALAGGKFGVHRFVESLENIGIVEVPEEELLNVNRPGDIFPP